MRDTRTWTDEELTEAVATSFSWRGVLRSLGLKATSTGSKDVAMRHARRLQLDCSHFRGQRTWSDANLRQAVSTGSSWTEVLRGLELTSNNGNLATVRSHAARLNLPTRHLDQALSPEPAEALPFQQEASLEHLRSAASLMAAAWFVQRGHKISWPLEPAVYDLVVESDKGLKRVQVKTTTARDKGGWVCGLARSQYVNTPAGKERVLYDPQDFEYFFVVDGDMNYYLLPMEVAAGKGSVSLKKYDAFRLQK